MAIAEDCEVRDPGIQPTLNIRFSKKQESGGITNSELPEMRKPRIQPTRERMELPKIPCLSISLRQWRQVQPVFWGYEDVHDSTTLQLQRFLLELQYSESRSCGLLQELWDQVRLVTIRVSTHPLTLFSEHKDINTRGGWTRIRLAQYN
jgi:hypothetical protein